MNLLRCRQNHNLFMKRNERENKKNKENAVRLIVHSITHRGEMWRGGGGAWSEGIAGGGGVAPLYQLISGMGEMVWQYINFPTLTTLKKGLLLTVIRIQGTAEARRCGAVAVRSQVITWSSQSWALAHFFEVRYPLPTKFFPLDRWRSCVHFLNFPFRSSLKRSSLNQWIAERKRAESLTALYYKIMYLKLNLNVELYCIVCPPPPTTLLPSQLPTKIFELT